MAPLFGSRLFLMIFFFLTTVFFPVVVLFVTFLSTLGRGLTTRTVKQDESDAEAIKAASTAAAVRFVLFIPFLRNCVSRTTIWRPRRRVSIVSRSAALSQAPGTGFSVRDA
jgi:hypothetical protein